MYYNYSEEQKYFLSVTDAMLKDDYSVDDIVEFWNCEDQEQVDGILSSLVLTESIDYGNPDLQLVCERFGWIAKGAKAFKNLLIRKSGGNPNVTMGSGTGAAIRNSQPPGFFGKIKNWLGGKANKVKDKVKKAPTGVKVAAGTALVSGAALKTMDVLDNMKSDDVKEKERVIAPGANDSDSKGKSEDDGKSGTPAKSGAWWKDYDKYDKSNYLHYRNIRKK